MTTTMKEHWEMIYEKKQPEEVSWTQEVPKHSLELIHELQLPTTASIIDIGGGDSKLVDHLLKEGYEDVTVLDISAHAIERAKKRLGPEWAQRVNWIVSDVLSFQPDRQYDLWHDRATFHFLTDETKIKQYVNLAEKAAAGYLVMGTFSDNGPEKCSGLPVTQYSETEMVARFAQAFEKLRCARQQHHAPTGATQEFLFCSFCRRKG